MDAKGNLYVTDTFNGRVQQFDVNGKFLRTFGALGDAWGNFDKPKGVATDSFGNLYVVDSGWSNVQIFNPVGQVLLFFGGRNAAPGFLQNPSAIAIDKRNRIYVGDYFGIGSKCTTSSIPPPPTAWSIPRPMSHPAKELPQSPEALPAMLLRFRNSLGRPSEPRPMASESLASKWTRTRTQGRRMLLVAAWVSGALLLGSCGPPPAFLDPLFPDARMLRMRAGLRRAGRDANSRRRKREAPVAQAPQLPARPDVMAIYATLPRNDDGQIMWMKAVADKLIAPKPGIADDAKEEEPTDMDVELEPKGQPEYKVVFSHKVHTQWLGCDNCHAALFEMEKGKTVITMDKINAGETCGVCHGKVAAPEPTACPACHEAMGK